MCDDVLYICFRCFLRSKPGMWTAYDGYVDVHAPENASDHDLFTRAVRQLASTSFPDRPSLSSWVFERSERLN